MMHLWQPPQPKPIYVPGQHMPIFPGMRGFDEAMKLTGLINTGMVNSGHALVDAGIIRCASPAGPPGTPTMWFKAGVGQFTTAAGSTACVNAGDPMGRWEDQSGNGKNLTQTSVSPDRRSRYQPNILNGYAVGESDEATNPIPNVNRLETFSPPWTIFLVVKAFNWNSGAMAGCGDLSGIGAANLIQHTSTPTVRLEGGLAHTSDLSTWTLNTWGVIMLQDSAGTLSIRLNKTTAVTGVSGGNNIDRFGLGEVTGIAGQKCQYAECIFYTSGLNSTNQDLAVDYLASKFGISV